MRLTFQQQGVTGVQVARALSCHAAWRELRSLLSWSSKSTLLNRPPPLRWLLGRVVAQPPRAQPELFGSMSSTRYQPLFLNGWGLVGSSGGGSPNRPPSNACRNHHTCHRRCLPSNNYPPPARSPHLHTHPRAQTKVSGIFQKICLSHEDCFFGTTKDVLASTASSHKVMAAFLLLLSLQHVYTYAVV
jgi:hypothetical protein